MAVFDHIAETFDAYGYKPDRKKPKFEPAFIRTIQVPDGAITIRFTDIDINLTALPTAYVVGLPLSIETKQLSHVNPDKSICYIDQETTKIFPLDPSRVIATSISLVEKVVDNWRTCGQNQDEVRAEFSSYWQPEAGVIRLGTESVGTLVRMDRTMLSGEDHKEFILVDNKSNQIDSWQRIRQATSVRELAPAIMVEVKKPFFVPYKTVWPPTSMKGILDWLKITDRNTLSVLVSKLKHNTQNSNDIFVELRQKEESIAFRFVLNKSAVQSLKRKAKYRLNDLVNILSNAFMTSNFTRLRVDDGRESFIYSRNSFDSKTLSNKRVILIGCGTIGGYTAHALAQCGAGTGNGSLHLFDDDTLCTGNLGRHILGANYLQENKSTALAHHLMSQLPFSNIQAHDKKFINGKIAERQDIIVDATGDETFSIQLAAWYRQHYKPDSKRPRLIHGWIDAYGECVRVLKDDGAGACYCCLCDFKGDGQLRLPLFASPPEVSPPFRRSCGSTYMPFPSQASMAAAGLIQAMALSATDDKRSNFRQLALSTRIKTIKDKRLSSSHGCPVCNR